jgi:dihydrofolate reductase
MSRVILSLQISLDGIASDPENWMMMSDEIIKDSIDYYDLLDAIIIGSNNYASLAEYWQKAEHSPKSETERRFAKKINEIKKIVISRSEVDLVWNNSEQLIFDNAESLKQGVEQLRKRYGSDISVESGLTSWQVFIEHDIFDELIVFIHPVVAGKGERLFTDNSVHKDLQLISYKLYQNGVMSLHYKKG